jgi:hypothetical protein
MSKIFHIFPIFGGISIFIAMAVKLFARTNELQEWRR